MIWFNLNEMEKKISNNDISEKESFKYYIAIFIVATLIALIIAIRVAVKQNSVQDNPIGILIHYLIDIVVTVTGLSVAFQINYRIDNNDFFKRFFPLSFVIFIRMTVYTVCIGLLLIVLIGLFIKFQDINVAFFQYLGHFLKIIFYILISLSYKRIAKLKQ